MRKYLYLYLKLIFYQSIDQSIRFYFRRRTSI